MQISGLVLIFTTMFATVIGQLAIKSGMLQIAGSSDGTMAIGMTLFNAFTNFRVIFGLGMAVVAASTWILALSRLPLSYAYPFLSVTFPVVVILSSYMFNEHVPARAYLGLTLILVGLVISSTGTK